MQASDIEAVQDTHGSFRELFVWQRAIELSFAIYRLTSEFPASERFGLTNQLRRAAVSVASNIAEGYGRSTKGEYVLFLGHARGSNCEVQTQLVISGGLGFGSVAARKKADELADEVGKMLVVLMRKLRKELRATTPCSLFPTAYSLFPLQSIHELS
jgi:four helix bundle protein